MFAARRTSLVAGVAWVLIVLLAMYLTFVGGGWFGIYAAPLRVASLLLATGVLLAWMAIMIRFPSWRPSSAIAPAIALAVGVLLVTTLVSGHPRVGIEYVAWAIVLSGLYLLLQRIAAHPFSRNRLGGLAAILCLLVCVLALAEVLGWWIEWWSLLGRIERPPLRPAFASLWYGNPSAVATMALLLYTSAAAGLAPKGTAGRAFLILLGLLVAAVVLVSGSRAGWLALVIALAAAALLWVGLRGVEPIRRWLSTRRARSSAAGGALLILAVAIVTLPGLVVRLGAGGEELRLDFFASAIRMFMASPLVGVGPGGWASQRVLFTMADERDYHVPHAHDLYLQTVAETGLLGLMAGAVLAVSILWLIRRGFRSEDPMQRRWAWAAVVGGSYLALHHLLDFYANMPAALFAYAIPIAMLDAAASGQPRAVAAGPQRVRLGRIALAGAIAASIALLGWAEGTALRYADGTIAANEGRWADALLEAEAVTQIDPDLPPHDLLKGLAAFRMGDDSSALAAFQSVADRDGLPVAWLAIARIRLDRGDASGASAALEKAMRLGHWDAAVSLQAGEMQLRLGNRALATEAYGAALAASGDLVDDAYWSDSAWSDVRNSAISRGIDGLLRDDRFREAHALAVTAGLVEAAAAIVDRLPADQRTTARLAAEAWAGDTQATLELLEYVEANPLDLYALSWAVRVVRDEGWGDEARRLQRMLFIASGSGRAGLAMTVIEAEGSWTLPVGVSPTEVSLFYGHYSYRRPTPSDQLLPGASRVVLVDDAAGPPGD